MKFDDGVIEFFNSFKGTDICLITDLTAHIQYRKIKKLGLDKYIKQIITSEEAGVEKPNPVMFNMALQKLDKSVSDVCMIGDNYTKDIIGATSLGINSFWMNRENEEKEIHPLCYEFKNFIELI